MSKSDGGPGLECAWCESEASRKQGRIWLCKKHYRFQQMRVTAKRHGKEVPEYWQLENILSYGFVCKPCGREMVWLSLEDQSRVVSLQHDESGTMRFLCRGCNTRHAIHPGDLYYEIDEGEKYCPMCKRILSESEFWKKNSTPRGLYSYCKDCSNERHRDWISRNRERYNRKHREYRAQRKQSREQLAEESEGEG